MENKKIKINRKQAIETINEIEISFKRTASYMNKKYERAVKIRFSFELFFTETYIVIYMDADISGSLPVRKTMQDIKDEYINRVVHLLPIKMDVGDNSLIIFPIDTTYPTRSDHLIDIMANAYHIIIPTSIGHGMDIADLGYFSKYKDLTSFMNENYVWGFRRDDGPPLLTDEDDCTLREYVVSILEYI